MGDQLNHSDIYKKLGFDSSNQWIFYDERFQKFFDFLSENITDENILTEHELLAHKEMVEQNEWLDEEDRKLKMKQIESENPGLLNCNEQDVIDLTQEIALIEKTTNEYTTLIEDMRNTKNSINSNLCDVEFSVAALQTAEKELLHHCQSKAKQLEELQSENCKLYAEIKKSFTKTQSPPLFMHQLPLDQYFMKCDSFMQYFKLYMKDNFKIQDYADFENNPSDVIAINAKMENLESSIQYYTLAYIKEKAKAKATQSLIEHVDASLIHCINLVDMTRETNELEWLNEHHLKNTYDTLMQDLNIHVQQHTQQRLELVLYENTKQKLDRALRRRENDKNLTKTISDALSNAELVWIAIQLDMEKKLNRFDNTEDLNAKAKSSYQRVQLMRSLNATNQGICGAFLNEIATLLGEYLNQNVRSDAKSCLYEYEKFGRMLSYAQQAMLNKKSYTAALEQIKELKRLEKSLQPFVYDSPLRTPMFENVRYLRPIFNATLTQHRIDKLLRNLRTKFQEQVTERMDNDKFWRYSQSLWIWFLTEPKRMLHAIDEVKKASAKVPLMTGIKTHGGIKRK